MARLTILSLATAALLVACDDKPQPTSGPPFVDTSATTPTSISSVPAAASAPPSTNAIAGGSASTNAPGRRPSSHALLKKPLEELVAACNKGDAPSCMAIAGKDLTEHAADPTAQARALSIFDKACGAGFLVGCGQLGELYANGVGVPTDLARAKELYERACTGGDPLGCTDLGVAYAKGQGVAKDEAKAFSLYQKGCEAGGLLACTNLGFVLSKGIGTAVDLDRAQAFYQRACDGDEPKGCVNLGSIYLRGNDKTPADRPTALKLYGKACALGDQASCDWVAKQPP